MHVVDEIGFAFGWMSPVPPFMHRTAHAVAAGGRVWVIDAIDDEGIDERIRALGDPAGVLQLLDRHGRDCARVAERLGVPHYAVPQSAPAGAPFEIVPLVDRKRWREVAAWFPEHRTLVSADAVGTSPHYLARGERLAVAPLLRWRPPRELLAYEPEHVLVGHGEGVHEDAAAALRDGVTHAARRLPGWLVSGALHVRPY